MTIGQRMKARRKELKMSADDLAVKLFKDRSTIYRYEKGDIENLPIDLLKPIADALDMTPAELMGWDEEKIAEASEIIKDENEYLDQLDAEFKSFMDEMYELELNAEELSEVFEYAKYIRSKRKEG